MTSLRGCNPEFWAELGCRGRSSLSSRCSRFWLRSQSARPVAPPRPVHLPAAGLRDGVAHIHPARRARQRRRADLSCFLFETGRGAPQNYTKAATWYFRAAEQGDSRGRNSLGLLYDRGIPAASCSILVTSISIYLRDRKPSSRYSYSIPHHDGSYQRTDCGQLVPA
jgi:hypothetical protein